jgi:hypothetical protein
MQFIKNNIAVIIAFALPLILILGVASTVYIPGMFLTTDYNFVYISCDNQGNYYRYDCTNYLGNGYSVVNNKLVYQAPADPKYDGNSDGVADANQLSNVRIFLHDNKTNSGREIELAEAQALVLSSLITAPDGVSVDSSYSRNGGFFPFFDGSSNYGHYLTKGRSTKRLNLINENGNDYYYNNFKFIGWVIGK